MSLARLSTIIFGSGVTISRLRAGKGVTVKVLERAGRRLTLLESGWTAKQISDAEATEMEAEVAA
jgi:hypothetical protein